MSWIICIMFYKFHHTSIRLVRICSDSIQFNALFAGLDLFFFGCCLGCCTWFCHSDVTVSPHLQGVLHDHNFSCQIRCIYTLACIWLLHIKCVKLKAKLRIDQSLWTQSWMIFNLKAILSQDKNYAFIGWRSVGLVWLSVYHRMMSLARV
jgi:hypothetical protein